MAKAQRPKNEDQRDLDPNSRATVSGPANPNATGDSLDDLTAKMAGTQTLASQFPFNATKASEYNHDPDAQPPVGALGKAATLLTKTGIPDVLPTGQPDPRFCLSPLPAVT